MHCVCTFLQDKLSEVCIVWQSLLQTVGISILKPLNILPVAMVIETQDIHVFNDITHHMTSHELTWLSHDILWLSHDLTAIEADLPLHGCDSIEPREDNVVCSCLQEERNDLFHTHLSNCKVKSIRSEAYENTWGLYDQLKGWILLHSTATVLTCVVLFIHFRWTLLCRFCVQWCQMGGSWGREERRRRRRGRGGQDRRQVWFSLVTGCAFRLSGGHWEDVVGNLLFKEAAV